MLGSCIQGPSTDALFKQPQLIIDAILKGTVLALEGSESRASDFTGHEFQVKVLKDSMTLTTGYVPCIYIYIYIYIHIYIYIYRSLYMYIHAHQQLGL